MNAFRMMSEPVLIGAAPGRHPRHDPDKHALFPHPPNCAGARLRKMMGLSLGQYCSIERCNVFREYPGPASGGKGDAFPMARARELAEAMWPDLYGRTIMLVRQGVARAFRMWPCDLLTWEHKKAWSICVMPHPSGRNRWWNDPENRARAEEFLADFGRAYRAHRDWLQRVAIN